MNSQFENYEIVLISDNTEDVQWVLKALKRSQLNNELIWLKDFDRTMDYLHGDGLYSGKGMSNYTKVFVVDSNFPHSSQVREEINRHCLLKTCKVLTLAEGKEEFFSRNDKASHQVISHLFGRLHALSMSFLF